MKKTAAILLLILILYPQITLSAQAREPGADCQYLLIAADRILEESAINPGKALVTAQVLYNITLPSNISRVHKEFYEALVTLLYTMNEIQAGGEVWREIHNLTVAYKELPEAYYEYSRKLVSCSGDPGEANTVRISGSLAIRDKILPLIERMIRNLLAEVGGTGIAAISLSRENASPGETIQVNITLQNSSLTNIAIWVVEWPTLNPVFYLENQVEGNTIYAEFTAPTLTSLKTLPLYEDLAGKGKVELAIVVSGTLAGTGERVLAYKVFEVTYKTPMIRITAPQSVAPGENVSFTIVSDAVYYNVSILLNGMEVANTTLHPGVNNYSLNPSDYGVRDKSVIVVGVRVPSGPDHFGVEKTKPILVSREPPGVVVGGGDILVSWTGFVSVPINTSTWEPLTATARLGPLTIYRQRVEPGNSSLEFFASILPATPLKVAATVTLDGGEYRASRSILIVNPTYTILLVALIVLAVSYRSGAEEHFTIPIVMPRAGARAWGRVLTTLSKSVESRIAELYYRTLLRLRIGLPRDSDTLREHYRRSLIPDRLRDPLWRLLRLAEEDLYSSHKPSYEEALKLLKRVLRR